MRRDAPAARVDVVANGPLHLPTLGDAASATPNKETVTPDRVELDEGATPAPNNAWGHIQPHQQAFLMPWFLQSPSEDWAMLLEAEALRRTLPVGVAARPTAAVLQATTARLRARALRPCDALVLADLLAWVHAQSRTTYPFDISGIFSLTWIANAPAERLRPGWPEALAVGLRRRALVHEAAHHNDAVASPALRSRARAARDQLWGEIQEEFARSLRRLYPGLDEDRRQVVLDKTIDLFLRRLDEGRFFYHFANSAEPVAAKLLGMSRNQLNTQIKGSQRELVSSEEVEAARAQTPTDERAPDPEASYIHRDLHQRRVKALKALCAQYPRRRDSLGQLQRVLDKVEAGEDPSQEPEDAAARKRKERGVLYLIEAGLRDPAVRELLPQWCAQDLTLEMLRNALKLLRRKIRTRLPALERLGALAAPMRRLLRQWRALALLLARAATAQRHHVEDHIQAQPDELRADLRFLLGRFGPRRAYTDGEGRWDLDRITRAEQALAQLRALLRAPQPGAPQPHIVQRVLCLILLSTPRLTSPPLRPRLAPARAPAWATAPGRARPPNRAGPPRPRARPLSTPRPTQPPPTTTPASARLLTARLARLAQPPPLCLRIDKQKPLKIRHIGKVQLFPARADAVVGERALRAVLGLSKTGAVAPTANENSGLVGPLFALWGAPRWGSITRSVRRS
jgi:hypothetical protein